MKKWYLLSMNEKRESGNTGWFVNYSNFSMSGIIRFGSVNVQYRFTIFPSRSIRNFYESKLTQALHLCLFNVPQNSILRVLN